jgi:hypothetical protein
MRIRFAIYSVAAAAVLGLMSLVLVSRPAAQGRGGRGNAAPDTAPTPRMSDGHPNLTGYWAAGAPAASDGPGANELTRTQDGSLFFSYAGANGGTEAAVDGYEGSKPQITAPYKPEYAAKVQKIIAVQYGRTNIYDPDLDCKPAGVPRAGFGGFVVSSPEAVAILYEATPGPYYRLIYTDGRPHPTDIDTSYMGNSIGHWDGDTLVVDTTALDDTTWLQGPGNSIHSDKEHVVERWTRMGNTVTTDTTVEDPVMFTKPWVLPTRSIKLMTGDPSVYGNYILPAMCNSNDKEHFRVNDKYVCNWCAPESLYGGDSDKLTVPDDARVKSGGGRGPTPAAGANAPKPAATGGQ